MSTGLNSAAAQDNQAHAKARCQAEFDALPPDERAAQKFEDLMSRWPLESKFMRLLPTLLYVRLGYHDMLQAGREAWQAELCVLCVKTDVSLIVPGTQLAQVLIEHNAKLTAQLSILLRASHGEVFLVLRLFSNAVASLMPASKLDRNTAPALDFETPYR